MQSPHILYEKRGHVGVITLNRPEALNACTRAMWARLEEVWADVNADASVWAVVLTGAGDRAFSAGADLKETASGQPSARKPRLWEDGDIEVWKPVITAVNGYALGSGFSMVLASDLRVVAEHAVFGMAQIRWGIASGTGTQLLPRALPYPLAMELLLGGKNIDARRAYELGLVNRVVPKDQLMPTAMTMAEELCQNAPLALRHAKEAAVRGMGMTLVDALQWGYRMEQANNATEDAKEGPRAFAEKRKPQWKGR